MRSVITNSAFSFIKHMIKLYEESYLHQVIDTLKKFFLILIQRSWIIHALKKTSTYGYEESIFLRMLRIFNLSDKAKSILRTSLIIRLATQPLMVGLLLLAHILSYGILPTAMSLVISLGLILLLYLFGQLNETLEPDPLFIISTLFLLASIFISGVLNPMNYDTLSILMIYGVTTFLILMLGCFGIHKKIFFMVLYALGVTIFLYSIYGVYQRIVGVQVDPAWLDENASHNVIRIFSVFKNPNVFGEFLVLTIPLMFAGSQVAEKLWLRLVFFSIFLLGALNILLTYSRGSMIGIVFAMVIIIIFRDRKFMPLLILGVLASPFILPDAIWSRVLTIFQGGDTSSAYRVSIYMSSLDMLRDHFLLGVGFGNFKEVYKVYAYTATKSFHAHNTWLMLWLEMGVLGIFAWMTFLFVFTKRLFALKNDDEYSYYAIAAFAGVVGCSLQGMVDHIFHNYDILFYYLLVIVFGFIAIRFNQEGEHG